MITSDSETTIIMRPTTGDDTVVFPVIDVARHSQPDWSAPVEPARSAFARSHRRPPSVTAFAGLVGVGVILVTAVMIYVGVIIGVVLSK